MAIVIIASPTSLLSAIKELLYPACPHTDWFKLHVHPCCSLVFENPTSFLPAGYSQQTPASL